MSKIHGENLRGTEDQGLHRMWIQENQKMKQQKNKGNLEILINVRRWTKINKEKCKNCKK